MKRTTIIDVAKKAGVSKGTVSAVINAKETVDPVTRDHILKVMKNLNFHPKEAPTRLRNGLEERSIGVIVKDLTYPFYTAIIAGAKEYAGSVGYSVIVTSSDDDHECEKRLVHLFSSKDIRGIIMAPIVEGGAEIDHLFKLKMINYPFVLLEAVKGIQANSVAVDNIKSIKMAVKYLMDVGHRRIVHFSGPQRSSHAQERIAGFRQAFSESALAFRDDMIVPVGSRYDVGVQRTMNYFKNRAREDYPTAIVCFNDQQALAVMTALLKLRIRVPDEVSIVGNDDIFYAQTFPVPLTTIRAPQHEIGRRAAEILIRNIESPVVLQTEQIVLETEFVVRESTKVLKK